MILRDIYECREIRLDEQKVRSGVLGVVEGVFFVPEKPSRNGRVYPRSLWERVLNSPDLHRLLQNRLMIGTVGHEDIDFDALIREQKVSHVVTKLWLGENGMGYGRAEILDTPVGRILYTLLKSGSKFAVSSKGWGDFKGTTPDGLQIVDASNYVLERFDFVVDPGFLDAIPELREQYESYIAGDKYGEVNSKVEVTEVLLKEKMVLQEKLSEVMTQLKKYEDENRELKEQLSKLRSDKKGISKELTEVCSEWLGVNETSQIKNEITMLGKLIEEEAELLVKRGVDKKLLEGETLSEVLVKVLENLKRIYRRQFIFSLAEAKKKEDIKDMAEVAHERRKLMSLRRELVREAVKNKKLSKLLVEAKRQLAKISSLGGIDEVAKALRMSEKLLRRLIKSRLSEEAEKLSARYGLSIDEAKKMIMDLGVDKATKVAKRSVLKAKESIKEQQEVVVVQDTAERHIVAESLADRIMSYIGKQVK